MATNFTSAGLSEAPGGARRKGRSALAADVNHLAHRLVAWFDEWRRYHETLRELSRLDDRELDDIGIARRDIPSIAKKSAAAAARV